MCQARSAKQLIIKEFEGNCEKEYRRLYDYRFDLLKKNPNSTVAIDAKRPTPDSKLVFLRFYVYFAALREGFIAGCRPIIGLDGVFLKGPYKGQLLSIIEKDTNNQMYPIAWAIVESESTSTWTWFLEYLNSNLKIGDGQYFTFIFDQQRHGMLVIQHRGEEYEDYVQSCYRKQAYIDINKNFIIPIDGMQFWADSGMLKIDPPIPKKKTPGRPKKKRHLEEWEMAFGSNMSRKVEESLSNAQNQVPESIQQPPAMTTIEDSSTHVQNQVLELVQQLATIDIQVSKSVQQHAFPTTVVAIQVQETVQQLALQVPIDVQVLKNVSQNSDQPNLNVEQPIQLVTRKTVMVPKRLPKEFKATCRSRVRMPSAVADDPSMNNSLNITKNVAGQANQKKKKGKVLRMVEIPNPQTALSILDVEICVRLRAIKQSRLDQMETTNWGSLLQAINEGSDGNACD
ncbi:hypothetical protein SLEP1_g36010 [Rubroshorea leprosula]|uniref:MULE transposase domain-containing protein n=1 Tax=Rubroshorea leprosula TaxID=152421 RepID=A0AAV5KQ41_9ROSI|nr:hypothetical protein SLEP1_g36010 [Rubroshorea leprosula]